MTERHQLPETLDYEAVRALFESIFATDREQSYLKEFAAQHVRSQPNSEPWLRQLLEVLTASLSNSGIRAIDKMYGLEKGEQPLNVRGMNALYGRPTHRWSSHLSRARRVMHRFVMDDCKGRRKLVQEHDSEGYPAAYLAIVQGEDISTIMQRWHGERRGLQIARLLRRHEIASLKALLGTSKDDLLQMYGLGPTTLQAIVTTLEKEGLELQR